MTVFGGLTILFGLGLLFATVEGDTSQLVLPNPWGLWIPLGALFALVGAFEGAVVMRGYLTCMGALIRAAPEEPRGPPPPEVLGLQREIRVAPISNTVLLLAALAMMVAGAGRGPPLVEEFGIPELSDLTRP